MKTFLENAVVYCFRLSISIFCVVFHVIICIIFQTEDVERIIRLSLTELRDAIKSGDLKPSQVLTAYQAKVNLIFTTSATETEMAIKLSKGKNLTFF